MVPSPDGPLSLSEAAGNDCQQTSKAELQAAGWDGTYIREWAEDLTVPATVPGFVGTLPSSLRLVSVCLTRFATSGGAKSDYSSEEQAAEKPELPIVPPYGPPVALEGIPNSFLVDQTAPGAFQVHLLVAAFVKGRLVATVEWGPSVRKPLVASLTAVARSEYSRLPGGGP